MEVFSVLELVLPLGDNAAEKPEAQLMADNLVIDCQVHVCRSRSQGCRESVSEPSELVDR